MGCPRQTHVVAAPSRNHVDMAVKDLLPSGLSRGARDVQPLRLQSGLEDSGDTMHRVGDVPVRNLWDIPYIPGMDAGNDQRVPWCRRTDVQERHGVLVLEDNVGRQPAGHDVTEGAVTHAPNDRSQPAQARPARIGSGANARSVAGLRCRVTSRSGDGERGALSLLVVILFVALAALAGLVVDGGAKLTADENADALAQEAARAGATTVDASSAYASGSFVVNDQQAIAAASDYLAAAGYDDYTVSAVGSRAIRVSVTITEPTTFLSLIGVHSFTCTGTATASLVTGVTGGA